MNTVLGFGSLCLSLLTSLVVGQGTHAGCLEQQCQDGWTYFRGSCYLFVDNINLDWTEAAHHCGLHHSTLAIIDNKAEDLFLQGYAKKLFRNPADRAVAGIAFWVGASDVTVEGLWTWYTDNSDLTYTNWLPGQPDSYQGHDEDCLHLFGPNDFEWGDAKCSQKAHPLCEVKLEEGLTVIG